MAKHGNYAATSVSGASNVIKNHGVEFTDDIDKLNRCINEAGIVYLHAQLFAKAMKFVGPIRKHLQFPTIISLVSSRVNSSWFNILFRMSFISIILISYLFYVVNTQLCKN